MQRRFWRAGRTGLHGPRRARRCSGRPGRRKSLRHALHHRTGLPDGFAFRTDRACARSRTCRASPRPKSPWTTTMFGARSIWPLLPRTSGASEGLSCRSYARDWETEEGGNPNEVSHQNHVVRHCRRLRARRIGYGATAEDPVAYAKKVVEAGRASKMSRAPLDQPGVVWTGAESSPPRSRERR